jgi:copper type II ascorbate-dependent monooxygenase-like protein
MRSIGTALCCLLVFSVAASGQDVTFNKDVLPILQTRCQSCHRPGEVAPMSFLTYQTTRPWARAMKAAVIQRKMPPGGLDPQYGHFVDNYALTQREIDTIARWSDSGAVEGDAKDAPPPLQWVDGWRTKPDVVIEAPAFAVPAKGWIENMILVLPNPFKHDTWVTSIEIRPGVTAAMHHAGVRFAPHIDGVKYGKFYWSDIKRDEAGFHIPGQPRPERVTFCDGDQSKVCAAPEANLIPDGAVAGFEGFYRPGGAPLDYAYYKSAYLIPANTDMILSLHWTPIGKPVTDVTKVGFVIAQQEPQRQLIMRALAPRGNGGWSDRVRWRIPAGDPNWEAPPKDAIFNVDAELAVMSIHMHEHGKDMTYMLMYPDGRVETILNQPRYDFNWQMTYNLERTIKVPKGTKMRVMSHFDNSPRNKFARDPDKDIFGGEQSWEEMDAPWIGLVLDRGVDPKTVYTQNPGDEATFWRPAQSN